MNELFVRTDTSLLVTKEHRHSVMMLTKILYRLGVIQEEQAMSIVTKFQILFV
jgi:hypothetical protein